MIDLCAWLKNIFAWQGDSCLIHSWGTWQVATQHHTSGVMYKNGLTATHTRACKKCPTVQLQISAT